MLEMVVVSVESEGSNSTVLIYSVVLVRVSEETSAAIDPHKMTVNML